VWETGLPPDRSAAGTRWQLFDISKDRNENDDLATHKRRQVVQMARMWDRWAQRVGVLPQRPRDPVVIRAPDISWPMVAQPPGKRSH
jgi:hypothetical protein